MNRTIQNPDEFVLEDVKMVHYEVMEQRESVWLGIYLNNGKMYHLNISGDNMWVNYSDETDYELAQDPSTGAPDAL